MSFDKEVTGRRRIREEEKEEKEEGTKEITSKLGKFSGVQDVILGRNAVYQDRGFDRFNQG